jgi:HPt (histidine-containing phosphotransfer) domain-containing protein
MLLCWVRRIAAVSQSWTPILGREIAFNPWDMAEKLKHPNEPRRRAKTSAAKIWERGVVSGEGDFGSAAKPVFPVAAVPAPVDMARLEALADGNETVLRELAELYLKETSRQIREVSDAIHAAQPEVVKRLAHSCAGASSTCGMTTIFPLFRELERRGDEGRLADAAEVAGIVQQEFERIQKFLECNLRLPPRKSISRR